MALHFTRTLPINISYRGRRLTQVFLNDFSSSASLPYLRTQKGYLPSLYSCRSNNRPSRSISCRKSSIVIHEVIQKRFVAAPADYVPPRMGWLSLLPQPLIPYAELSRLDKPAGALYLFFPCAFSTLLAAQLSLLSSSLADVGTLCSTTTLFFVGAFIMRGAGCTINDFWDRDLDPHVARTRLRPIARGAVAPLPALAWAAMQCLLGLGVLVHFPVSCLYWGTPSLFLVGTYPLAKRVTHYPQVVLGLAFSWGALMGFPALGVDLLAVTPGNAGLAAVCLYGSCVSWTVLYDMIYAHMDIRDDKGAGIKSIALKHDKETKPVLSGLAFIQITLLAASGISIGAGPMFYLGSCAGAALTIATMITKVDLKKAESCWWWFRHGCWITGGTIIFGLGADWYTNNAKSLPSIESEELQ